MDMPRLLIFTTMLTLAACAPKPQLTTQQVLGVKGLSKDAVREKLGGPHVVTDAGDSIWWMYDDVAMPDKQNTTSCQVIFRKGVADTVKC